MYMSLVRLREPFSFIPPRRRTGAASRSVVACGDAVAKYPAWPGLPVSTGVTTAELDEASLERRLMGGAVCAVLLDLLRDATVVPWIVMRASLAERSEQLQWIQHCAPDVAACLA